MNKGSAILGIALAVSLVLNACLLLGPDGGTAPKETVREAAVPGPSGVGMPAATSPGSEHTEPAATSDVNVVSSYVKQLAFIRGLERSGDGYYVKANDAEWFSGEEAERAAREDGDPEAGSLANGFYIRNMNEDPSPVWLSPEASIYVLEGTALRSESYEQFTESDPGDRLFHMGIVNGAVILLEEQYRP